MQRVCEFDRSFGRWKRLVHQLFPTLAREWGVSSRLDTSHHITIPRATRPSLQSLLKREKGLDLQGHEGNETSDNGTEGDDVAASSVEGGGGGLGSGGSGGGASGLDVGGALQGAGANGADGYTGGRGSSSGSDGGLGADGGGDLPGADDSGGRSSSGGSSSRGAGLILGAVGGGDIVDDGDDGQLGGRGSSSSLGSLGGGDSGGSGALSLGETELGGPLVGTVVGTGILNDDQETVVGDIGGQAGAGSPDELARVGDALSEGLDGDDVVGGAAQEDDRDGLAQVVIPLDGVGLALGDLLVQAGGADGVTLRSLGVVGGGVGSSDGREGRDESSSREAHGDGWIRQMTAKSD